MEPEIFESFVKHALSGQLMSRYFARRAAQSIPGASGLRGAALKAGTSRKLVSSFQNAAPRSMEALNADRYATLKSHVRAGPQISKDLAGANMQQQLASRLGNVHGIRTPSGQGRYLPGGIEHATSGGSVVYGNVSKPVATPAPASRVTAVPAPTSPDVTVARRPSRIASASHVRPVAVDPYAKTQIGVSPQVSDVTKPAIRFRRPA